jgi:hypothetical protein
MKKGIWALGILILALPALSDGPNSSSWELFFLYGLDLSGKSIAYANSYDPNPGYHIPGSYAKQTLNLDPGTGQGFALGAGYYFSGGFGVRLTARRRSIPLGGENTPYEYFYRYTLIYPPYYEPIESVTQLTLDWVPTDGKLNVTSLALEAAFRLPVAAGISAVLFAGPSLQFVEGRFSPLGFTDEWLGGHGTPNRQHYLVHIKLPREQKIGLQAGLELSIRLSGKFSALVSAAYSYSGEITFIPAIDEVYYDSSLRPASQETLDLIESRFDLKPLPISFSAPILGAGLKFEF